MNIEQALEGLKDLIDSAESSYSEAYYLGKDTWNALDALNFVYGWCSVMKPVPTTHDSKAEGESWDVFFAERRKAAGLE